MTERYTQPTTVGITKETINREALLLGVASSVFPRRTASVECSGVTARAPRAGEIRCRCGEWFDPMTSSFSARCLGCLERAAAAGRAWAVERLESIRARAPETASEPPEPVETTGTINRPEGSAQ